MRRIRLIPVLSAIAAASLLILVAISRSRPGLPPKPAPADRKGAPPEVPASVATEASSSASPRRSQDYQPFLMDGDPQVIRAILSELDRSGMPAAFRERLFARLKEEIDGLYTKHGIHALPLFSRILSDLAIPPEVRSAALAAFDRYSYPQTVDFLAGEVVRGGIAPDAAAAGLHVLSRLAERLHEAHRTAPLVDLCRQAYERAISSLDDAVREAAVRAYVVLARPAHADSGVRVLFGLLSSDPSGKVRTAAAQVLGLHGDFTNGNEWLANQMRARLGGSDPADRLLALDVLVATGTDVARRSVLECLQDPSRDIMGKAIFGAGRLKLAEAVPDLVRILGDADSFDLTLRRHYVLPALSKIPGLESARALLASASLDAEEEIRLAAFRALRGNESARERLGEDLATLYEARPDGSEREEIAFLLSQSFSPRAYDLLCRAYFSSEGEARVDLATLLLDSPRGPDFVQANFSDLMKSDAARYAVPKLMNAAPDRALLEIERRYIVGKGEGLAEATRRSAIRALGELGSPRAAGVLKGILDVEPDRDLRDDAESALRRVERQD